MKKIRTIAMTVIILAVALGAGYLALRHVPADTYAVQEIDGTAHWGSISGSVSYPSEMLPFMGICAETVDGADQYCTYELVPDGSSLSGYGYELAVPPDEYYVFAHEVAAGNESVGYVDEYRAYYSEFVTCGLEYTCPSHKPIPVEVARNQYLQGIDPTDWYNQ
ncbi:MAG: hypothetical protein WC505_01865 [Patescibacteria group bacterium]